MVRPLKLSIKLADDWFVLVNLGIDVDRIIRIEKFGSEETRLN